MRTQGLRLKIKQKLTHYTPARDNPYYNPLAKPEAKPQDKPRRAQP